MYRALCFIGILTFTAVFGWWLFIPLSIIYVFLVKLPYEIIILGLVFDSTYYFGGNFVSMYRMTILSLLLIGLALFLNERIRWNKVI